MLLAIHAHVGRDPRRLHQSLPGGGPASAVRIIDFIAGMTDNYAMNLYEKIRQDHLK